MTRRTRRTRRTRSGGFKPFYLFTGVRSRRGDAEHVVGDKRLAGRAIGLANFSAGSKGQKTRERAGRTCGGGTNENESNC